MNATDSDTEEKQKISSNYDAIGVFDAKRYERRKSQHGRGRTAVWQARLVLLVMINLAQLWILSATVEAALAEEYRHLLPLIVSSLVCWGIALSIYFWWKPAAPRDI
ncbi:MAG: hypothetical protein ACK5NT_01605 [Pyrinomonadaceae bacterium]